MKAGDKRGQLLTRASLEFAVTYITTRLLKQTPVLDKSGHNCGRFNKIKCNRITTQRYM